MKLPLRDARRVSSAVSFVGRMRREATALEGCAGAGDSGPSPGRVAGGCAVGGKLGFRRPLQRWAKGENVTGLWNFPVFLRGISPLLVFR